MVYRFSYKAACMAMQDMLGDLRILAGDKVAPSDVSWQDVAGTAAVNLRYLASLIDAARQGKATADEPIVFPSPDDFPT